MSATLHLNIFSKDWEIHGDGVADHAKFNLIGWPFNLDLSEMPTMEMSAYVVSGGGGKDLGVFTASPQDERILLASHGLAAGDQIRFVLEDPTSCALPTPLSETTAYFVSTPRGNDFMVAGTSGGTVINLTDKGIGANHVWVGGSAEVLDPLVCKQDGTFITLQFPAPIPNGGLKTVRLMAKVFV